MVDENLDLVKEMKIETQNNLFQKREHSYGFFAITD